MSEFSETDVGALFVFDSGYELSLGWKNPGHYAGNGTVELAVFRAGKFVQITDTGPIIGWAKPEEVAEWMTRCANGDVPEYPRPYRVMGLRVGEPVVESEHDTEREARDALAAIHRTCAPFIRDSFWIEGP